LRVLREVLSHRFKQLSFVTKKLENIKEKINQIDREAEGCIFERSLHKEE
jgi:hypothetical protein